MTIEQQLQALAQIKSDLKDAILAQGVDIDDSTPFADYATKVSFISGGGVQLPQNVFCSRILGTEVTSE
jgi:hypothetical protein